MPRGINLHSASSMHRTAVSVSTSKWVLVLRMELILQGPTVQLESQGPSRHFSISPSQRKPKRLFYLEPYLQSYIFTLPPSSRICEDIFRDLPKCLSHKVRVAERRKRDFYFSSLVINCYSPWESKQMLFWRQRGYLMTTANFHQTRGVWERGE